MLATAVVACLFVSAYAQDDRCLGIACPGGIAAQPDAPPVVAARPSSPPPGYVRTREEPPLLRAGEPFTPLTAKQKWRVFVHHTYAPSTFIDAGLDAGYTQATRGEAGYGQGAAGFGRRLGASLASSESDVFFERFLFPVLLHQDPRYFHAPAGSSTTQRGLFAMEEVVVGTSDSGHRVFNCSHVCGALASLALSNAYLPRRDTGVGPTFSRWGISLASDAGFNILREFWPDIRRRLLRTSVGKRIDPMVERVHRTKPSNTP